MVSQAADMKVYLEGSKKRHETGEVLHQKNTVNLFTHIVVPFPAASYCITFHKALLLSWLGTNFSETMAGIKWGPRTYSTSLMVPALPPCQWWMQGWRPLQPRRLAPPAPSNSCCWGWGCAAVWSEQGYRAPRSPRWASGSSSPRSPGSPGAPGSTGQPHLPPQIPVNSLVQHPLWRCKINRNGYMKYVWFYETKLYF